MNRATILVLLGLLLAPLAVLALTVGPFTADDLRAALGDARFHNEAGYALGQSGDWEGAYREFLIALDLDPSMESAQHNAAIAAFHTGRYAASAARYRDLVAQDPGNRAYRFDLAQSLVAHARFQETDGNAAVADLRAAIDLLESVGDYPHARENALIVRDVLAGVGA